MRKIIAALAASAAFAVAAPAVADAHAGDLNTSLQNAVSYCVQSYGRCSYQHWLYEDYGSAHPYRRFYFWRLRSDGRAWCYTGIRTNHYNVVVGNATYQCQ